MRDLLPLIFQGLSGLLANHLNPNTVQFWFYKTYQETSSVVSHSKNDVSYQMGSTLEKWFTIYSTKTLFFSSTIVGNAHTIKSALLGTV